MMPLRNREAWLRSYFKAAYEYFFNKEDTMTDSTTTTAAKVRRHRVGTYGVKLTGKFIDHADEPQACVDRRKKLEAYARELGFTEVESSGFFGSTMIDVPKT